MVVVVVVVRTILLETTCWYYWDDVTPQMQHSGSTLGEGSAYGEEGSTSSHCKRAIHDMFLNYSLDSLRTIYLIALQLVEY